jgi:phospholipid transport system substrate-binding protein
LKRRTFARWAACIAAVAALGLPQWALADEGPDAFIKRLSDEVMGAIKSDDKIRAGDTNRVLALVNSKIMPNVDFARMTAATVGPAWRQATPEQNRNLEDEINVLLVRTY